MSKIKTLHDITIYNEALLLTKEIYKLTRHPKLCNDFSLVDQLRRSSLSVTANIAEGYGRKSKKDFAQFVSISLGSTNEIISYLDFISLEYKINIQKLYSKYEILAKRIFTFRKYLLKPSRK